MTLWNQLLSLHTWKGDLMVCFCREGDFTAAALMTSCVSFTTTHIYFYFFLFLFLHRTLITGMVSGSIVAFNIDFNRWHQEHQNRYWAEEHQPNALARRASGLENKHGSIGFFLHKHVQMVYSEPPLGCFFNAGFHPSTSATRQVCWKRAGDWRQVPNIM